MNLIINGDPRHFSAPLTLSALIDQLEMKSDRVAVELNCNIVPREKWAETTLSDNDRLEIVHFVGGGTALTQIAEQARSQPRSGGIVQ